jgi:hypothetical protein
MRPQRTSYSLDEFSLDGLVMGGERVIGIINRTRLRAKTRSQGTIVK